MHLLGQIIKFLFYLAALILFVLFILALITPMSWDPVGAVDRFLTRSAGQMEQLEDRLSNAEATAAAFATADAEEPTSTLSPTPTPMSTSIPTLAPTPTATAIPPTEEPSDQEDLSSEILDEADREGAEAGFVEDRAEGIAPQTPEEASEILNVPTTALTVLYQAAGDPTAVGWVVGDPQFAEFYSVDLPVNTCVDWAAGRTREFDGSTSWTVKYSGVDWYRSLMSGSGSITTTKATIWWTPCEQEDGEEVEPSELDTIEEEVRSGENPVEGAVVLTCPTFDGVKTTPIENRSACKLSWDEQRGVVTGVVPAGWLVEHDGEGSPSASGETITFGSATFRPAE